MGVIFTTHVIRHIIVSFSYLFTHSVLISAPVDANQRGGRVAAAAHALADQVEPVESRGGHGRTARRGGQGRYSALS